MKDLWRFLESFGCLWRNIIAQLDFRPAFDLENSKAGILKFLVIMI